ncbi:hypothetical protein ACH4T9_19895 [Micromonospora sp. NPDC020750]|uniref:hypothetical protein n=1 Tax=unclassified Micromonospora TaxID=2617518 RepID=UPI0037B45DE7
MTALLIATHDQALHAIGERTAQPGTDPLLVSVVAAAMTAHRSYPSPTNRPDPDCFTCHGLGRYQPDGAAEPLHCHCRCPWCGSCEQPLCEGPCETVAVIGAALGIPGLAAPERERP